MSPNVMHYSGGRGSGGYDGSDAVGMCRSHPPDMDTASTQNDSSPFREGIQKFKHRLQVFERLSKGVAVSISTTPSVTMPAYDGERR